jgi:hypothetical protein
MQRCSCSRCEDTERSERMWAQIEHDVVDARYFLTASGVPSSSISVKRCCGKSKRARCEGSRQKKASSLCSHSTVTTSLNPSSFSSTSLCHSGRCRSHQISQPRLARSECRACGVFATMDSWPKGFWDSFEDICFFTYLGHKLKHRVHEKTWALQFWIEAIARPKPHRTWAQIVANV